MKQARGYSPPDAMLRLGILRAHDRFLNMSDHRLGNSECLQGCVSVTDQLCLRCESQGCLLGDVINNMVAQPVGLLDSS